jgi:hypothetical protein
MVPIFKYELIHDWHFNDGKISRSLLLLKVSSNIVNIIVIL